jgi:hypothetical protein
LAGGLVSAAAKELSLGRHLVAAGLAVVVWADAVAAIERSDDVRGHRMVLTLAGDPGSGPDGRVHAAALAWFSDGDPTPVIPSAGGGPSWQDEVRAVETSGRTYHGVLAGGNGGVLVVEQDGSTRLLHNEKAASTFTWGYSGTGPIMLGRALVNDLLLDALRCPACLGGVRFGAGLVRCADCGTTGYRHPPREIALHLVAELISRLPAVHGCEPTVPGALWSLTDARVVELAGQL